MTNIMISNEIFNHNKEKCNVIKTYQMYRKDSFEALKEDSKFLQRYIFWNKIVRGAIGIQKIKIIIYILIKMIQTIIIIKV